MCRPRAGTRPAPTVLFGTSSILSVRGDALIAPVILEQNYTAEGRIMPQPLKVRGGPMRASAPTNEKIRRLLSEPAVLLFCYSSAIRASVYWAAVAPVPSLLTSTVQASRAFSIFSAAAGRQMCRSSMAEALIMEAGLA